ncbi:MAG: hypothetical protein U9R03_04895 [Candidatus Aerophobetes bacterium]|nr:hypothetical protein [Candidatus Aerophobetes bacterium]
MEKICWPPLPDKAVVEFISTVVVDLGRLKQKQALPLQRWVKQA